MMGDSRPLRRVISYTDPPPPDPRLEEELRQRRTLGPEKWERALQGARLSVDDGDPEGHSYEAPPPNGPCLKALLLAEAPDPAVIAAVALEASHGGDTAAALSSVRRASLTRNRSAGQLAAAAFASSSAASDASSMRARSSDVFAAVPVGRLSTVLAPGTSFRRRGDPDRLSDADFAPPVPGRGRRHGASLPHLQLGLEAEAAGPGPSPELQRMLSGIPELDGTVTLESPVLSGVHRAPSSVQAPTLSHEERLAQAVAAFFIEGGTCCAMRRASQHEVAEAARWAAARSVRPVGLRPSCVTTIDATGTRLPADGQPVSPLLRFLYGLLVVDPPVVPVPPQNASCYVRALVLDECGLGDTDAEVVADLIRGGASPIAMVSLRRNQITALGAELLKKAVKYNPAVVALDLEGNPIAGPGLEAVRILQERLQNNRNNVPNRNVFQRLLD